jgi:hypothetical protein
MITAKNYAAQAERALGVYVVKARQAGVATEGELSFFEDNFIKQIPKAVHFALPDNGELLQDGLRGLKGVELHLPFPSVTIEYFVSEGRFAGIATEHSPRRLALARELPTSTIVEWASSHHVSADRYQRFTDDTSILILVAFEVQGMWIPSSFGFVMGKEWDRVTENTQMAPSEFVRGKDQALFTGQLFPLMPTSIEFTGRTHGMEILQKSAFNDIAGEVNTLLSMCEALVCSNVGTEDLQTGDPKVNARRAQNKKLPIYTTKILTINTKEGGKKSGDYTPGSGTSPRQHLRRGHIRRLQSGEKIWVNSCVVGDRENGFIEKSYRVK